MEGGPDPIHCCKCKSSFNQTERFEVTAYCGHSFCLMCFFDLVPPQENNLTCPIDNEVQKISEAFKKRMQQRAKDGPLWILCDKHPTDFVSCYC